MLLYHRPVPAKIPKRRSRAGEHAWLLFHSSWSQWEFWELEKHYFANLKLTGAREIAGQAAFIGALDSSMPTGCAVLMAR